MPESIKLVKLGHLGTMQPTMTTGNRQLLRLILGKGAVAVAAVANHRRPEQQKWRLLVPGEAVDVLQPRQMMKNHQRMSMILKEKKSFSFRELVMLMMKPRSRLRRGSVETCPISRRLIY